MSCTCAALVDNVFAHRSKDGLHCLECVFISSNKNIQRGIPCAHVAARNGRIQRVDAALFCFRIDALGKGRGGGRHISSVCALRQICEDAVRTEVDLLYILWITDNGDDGILTACAYARAFTVFRTARNERIRLAFRAVVDAELIARIHQMTCHRRAHDAKSDKADFFHNKSSIP